MVQISNFLDHPYTIKKGMHIANFSISNWIMTKWIFGFSRGASANVFLQHTSTTIDTLKINSSCCPMLDGVGSQVRKMKIKNLNWWKLSSNQCKVPISLCHQTCLTTVSAGPLYLKWAIKFNTSNSKKETNSSPIFRKQKIKFGYFLLNLRPAHWVDSPHTISNALTNARVNSS